MKTAIVASLVAGAAAFAPSQDVARTSVAMNAFEDELGATRPLGFFDPLGLVSDGDEEKFNRLRYTEIKHGRISMLAVIGYLWTYAGIRLPGNIAIDTPFADIRSGFAAFNDIPAAGMLQLIGLIGFLELNVMRDVTNSAEFPGDLRNGYLDFGWDKPTLFGIEDVDFGWEGFSEEDKIKKRNIEINNGRAAMMGILALMFHEQLGVSLLPEDVQGY